MTPTHRLLWHLQRHYYECFASLYGPRVGSMLAAHAINEDLAQPLAHQRELLRAMERTYESGEAGVLPLTPPCADAVSASP